MMSCITFGQDCYDYRHTTDAIPGKVIVDPGLASGFFNTYTASYPWYITRTGNGKFESALDRPITREDLIALEHTSNCMTTHQGKHIMDYCDADYSSGVLVLEIHGGMPAYTGSLLISVKNSAFTCSFKSAYPARGINCLAWTIVSKKLTLKNASIIKGKRVYAWISVVFDEVSGSASSTHRYTIEGYIKPVVH